MERKIETGSVNGSVFGAEVLDQLAVSVDTLDNLFKRRRLRVCPRLRRRVVLTVEHILKGGAACQAKAEQYSE